MPSTLEASTNRMGLLVDEGWISPRGAKFLRLIDAAGNIAGHFADEKISSK
jgi:hypothetical protein